MGRRRAAEIVDFVGLGPRRDVPARHLTLPDRKRLEVARGLATEPRLLLLDEVMSGLNPTEIEAIIGLIRRIHARGVSLLIIEHVMRAILALSHRLVVLHHGEKIRSEEHTSELQSQSNLVCRLLLEKKK